MAGRSSTRFLLENVEVDVERHLEKVYARFGYTKRVRGGRVIWVNNINEGDCKHATYYDQRSPLYG